MGDLGTQGNDSPSPANIDGLGKKIAAEPEPPK
jgi:hypothetical protein